MCEAYGVDFVVGSANTLDEGSPQDQPAKMKQHARRDENRVRELRFSVDEGFPHTATMKEHARRHENRVGELRVSEKEGEMR